MKKAFPYILLALMALAVLLLRKNQSPETNTTPPEKTTKKKDIDRNRGFDRRTAYLEYTAHARCRMQCRKIAQREVEEIMKNGKINYKKSDVNDKPCPTYALEGITSDAQRVRIVYAQCDHSTKVVTVIDLETDFECDCPGDKKK